METDPRSEAVILDLSACWALLRRAHIGRLAVAVAGHPDIFPINYQVDHATIVFRTAEGTKLAAIAASSEVAFEIDGWDELEAQAWSVVIKGQAREIKDIYDVLDTMALPLFPWQGGPKHRFVRIVPDDISGRRFSVVDAKTWTPSLVDAPHADEE